MAGRAPAPCCYVVMSKLCRRMREAGGHLVKPRFTYTLCSVLLPCDDMWVLSWAAHQDIGCAPDQFGPNLSDAYFFPAAAILVRGHSRHFSVDTLVDGGVVRSRQGLAGQVHV